VGDQAVGGSAKNAPQETKKSKRSRIRLRGYTALLPKRAGRSNPRSSLETKKGKGSVPVEHVGKQRLVASNITSTRWARRSGARKRRKEPLKPKNDTKEGSWNPGHEILQETGHPHDAQKVQRGSAPGGPTYAGERKKG